MEERRKDYINITGKIDNIDSTVTDIKISQARLEERQIAIDKRINGSIDDIQTHISHGNKWRIAVVSTFVIIVLNALVGVYQYGRVCERVDALCKDVEKCNERNP